MAIGQSFIISLGTFILIYFSITKFLDGRMTLGTIAFIYSVYGMLVNSSFGVVHGIRGYYRSMADFEELFGYGKIKNENYLSTLIKEKVEIGKDGSVQN